MIPMILAGLMLILSVYMILGKGSWLISGYNTMSEEEKAKYDGPLLSKWIGYSLVLPISIMIGALSFLQTSKMLFPIIVVFVIYTLGMIIFISKKGIARE